MSEIGIPFELKVMEQLLENSLKLFNMLLTLLSSVLYYMHNYILYMHDLQNFIRAVNVYPFTRLTDRW